MNPAPAQHLTFVTAASRIDVLRQHLCASPCIRDRRRPLVAYFNVGSAAEAFNAALASAGGTDGTWLVWVHQDVLLPGDWDEQFLAALRHAQQAFPKLAVAGVYGMSGPVRAGHVLDRGNVLHEAAVLPCAVDSVDELLFAVRADAGLLLDAQLGFDFYGTDVVLQAQQRDLQAAVVDAYCEHWSDTPAGTPIPTAMADRIVRSGRAFEAKWAARLPVHTSWLAVQQRGDVDRFIDSLRP